MMARQHLTKADSPAATTATWGIPDWRDAAAYGDTTRWDFNRWRWETGFANEIAGWRPYMLTGWLDKANVGSYLDDVVPNIIKKHSGKKVIPGWHLVSVNSPFELGFTVIRHAKFPDGVEYVPSLTEERAGKLVELAKTDAHAFDAASYIAGINIAASSLKVFPDLPTSLRLFGSGVLMGIYTRPPQKGRSRIDDVPLRMHQYLLCRIVENCGPLPLSRNREPKGQKSFSVCDAVAEAFTRAGPNVTHANMVSLCYDKPFFVLRMQAEALFLHALSELPNRP